MLIFKSVFNCLNSFFFLNTRFKRTGACGAQAPCTSKICMLFDYSNGQILTINPSKNLIKYTHSVNNNTSCHLIHDLKKKSIYCIGVLTSGYVGSCEKPENPENYTHPHVCILFRLIQQ